MAESLRQIKRRVRSVENTKKITKAIEMVAASKLKKYQDLLGQTKAYMSRLERMLGDLISATSSGHPLFETRKTNATLVFLITSDSGLCGSYNYNLFQLAERFLAERSETVSFFAIGRQGFSYLKRKQLEVSGELAIPRPQEIEQTVSTVKKVAEQKFIEHTVSQIFLIYTEFISMASYKPKVEQLLPLSAGGRIHQLDGGQNLKGSLKTVQEYILEPNPERILEEMVPHYLQLKIEQALKEALVSEQVSRMIAMKQATDNATEMIDDLTLQRNKARQAGITKELIEIVSGAKALQTK